MSRDDEVTWLTSISGELREFRTHILLKVGKFVDDQVSAKLVAGAIDGSSFSRCGCNFHSLRAATILQRLKRDKLWPLSVTNGRTLESTIQAAKSLQLGSIAKCKNTGKGALKLL